MFDPPGYSCVSLPFWPSCGTPASQVSTELARFEAEPRTTVAELDAVLPVGQDPDEMQLVTIVRLCAWVHSEWVRIHLLANGNGRTARVWANWVALRYGLPPFIRLRPRPDGGYEDAAARARGNWMPTSDVFLQMLKEFMDTK